MPASPGRRVLHEKSPSDHNRLQIRLVPYSPPRLSSDGSLSCVDGPAKGRAKAKASSGEQPTSPVVSSGAFSHFQSLPRQPKSVHSHYDKTIQLPHSRSALLKLLRRPSAVSSPLCDVAADGQPGLPRTPPRDALPTCPAPLGPGPSSQSSRSGSTLSERSNYKTYAHGAPAVTTDGGRASPQSVDDGTSGSEANYLVHHHLPSSSSIPASLRSQPTSEHRTESLLVPPLRPAKSTSEQRTGSLRSISSILAGDTPRPLFAGVAAVRMPGGVSGQESSRPSCNTDPKAPSPPSGYGRRSSQGARAVGMDQSREQPECPSSVHHKASGRGQNHSTIRLIRHQDEHGDGLADLEKLHHRSSRTRLYSLLSNHSSDRNLWSSGSSRNNSCSHPSIPAWARLYYGSGERRFLAARPSSDSLFSHLNGGSQGSSPSRRPSAERLPAVLDGGRHQPRREAVSPGLRKQSSSLWSPHLHRDKRVNRCSIWQTPSAVWSADGASPWFRNLQPVLFVVGFIFPFAWVIASCLPLPTGRHGDAIQAQHSTIHHPGLRPGGSRPGDSHQAEELMEARRYTRARWWRSLNRAMSIVGMFVTSAIVALIVTGVRQR